MDGLQVDTRKQPDLEVATQSHSAPKQDYSQHLLVTKYEAPPYHQQDSHAQTPGSPTATSRDSRICGLKRKTFFIVLAVVLLLVIGGAVGGGVGGSLASKNSNDNAVVTPTPTPTPTPTSSQSTSGTSTSSSATGTGTLSTTAATITPGVYRVTNVMGGTAIDLLNGGTVNGTAITGWAIDLTATKEDYVHQAWQISLLSPGLVTIVNAEASSYIVAPRGLDPVSNPTDSLAPAAVYGTPDSSTTDKYAQWKVTAYSDDSFSFSSVVYPEKMIDLAYGNSTNGVYITVWTEHASANQRWKLLPS